MKNLAMLLAGLAVAIPLHLDAHAEDLEQAWMVAQRVNAQLDAQRLQSRVAGLNLDAARRARLPSVQNFTVNALITPAPRIKNPQQSGSNGSNSGGFGQIFGNNQHELPISSTSLVVPIYTGGRLKANVANAGEQLNAQKTEEMRTGLDLKLTVAEAYVGVLRAGRDLQVSLSDVERLGSFGRDVKNRLEQGLATRNDQLAASVSLSNARLREIQSRKTLAQAWATYNRYLCRPFGTVVEMQDLRVEPGPPPPVPRSAAELAIPDEQAVAELTDRAIRLRPELAGLAAQSRGLDAQADAARSVIRPQITSYTGHTLLGSTVLSNDNFLTSTVLLQWTLTDSGSTRRRTEALRTQARATSRRQADAATDVALQVRTRWLDVQETRQRIPVAREAIAQAEENIKVVLDRYSQGLSTYTEVLDAENRRVQAATNDYDANYDSVLATFRLRRAVGDL